MLRCTLSGQLWLRPSSEMRKFPLRLSTLSDTTELSCSTMGRMLSEWGATGVRQMVSDCGTMMGPPTLSE